MIAYKIKDSRKEPIEFVRRKEEEQNKMGRPQSKAGTTLLHSQLEMCYGEDSELA